MSLHLQQAKLYRIHCVHQDRILASPGKAQSLTKVNVSCSRHVSLVSRKKLCLIRNVLEPPEDTVVSFNKSTMLAITPAAL